jgi:hypothetical protein
MTSIFGDNVRRFLPAEEVSYVQRLQLVFKEHMEEALACSLHKPSDSLISLPVASARALALLRSVATDQLRRFRNTLNE